MMKCNDLETNAIAYMDGKLPPAQRNAMELHLAVCPACRERIEGFTQVLGLLDEWEGVQPSSFFQTRLTARLEEEAVTQGWWKNAWRAWIPRPVTGSLFAIVFAVVVTVGVVLLRYSPTPSPVEMSQPAAPAVAVVASAGDETALYQDLPLLEDWEVLRNFEVLQELSNTTPVMQ